MSSSHKRPQIRKKPEAAAGGPAPAPAAPVAAAAGGGLLGNILESVKRLDESRSKAALPDGAAKLQEERAAESRRLFEQDAEAVMRRAELASTPPRTPHARARKHVLESPDEDVYFDFAPAERPWRDLLHEVGTSLGLYTETTESPDGDRFVTVRKKPQAGVLSKHELKALARSVPSAPKRSKYDAPPPPEAVDVVVTLNQKKRDLRSIEEVQEEMRKKTQKGEAGGAEAAPTATG